MPTLTADQQVFLVKLKAEAIPVALANLLPPSALLACACAESGFGTSKIFQKTGCPFNLQKPDHYTWIKCDVIKLETIGSSVDKKTVWVNFCKTKTLAEAAQVWCDWILNWPYKPSRDRILKQRLDGDGFARTLPWVGFGTQTEEWRKKNGADFAKVRTEQGFAVHDLPFDMLKALTPALGLLGLRRAG
jgi:hypothetical protein